MKPPAQALTEASFGPQTHLTCLKHGRGRVCTDPEHALWWEHKEEEAR